MVNCIVIDDDQNIVDVFCELLEMANVDILATGNNGLDAVNLYKKHHPDIVFTDLNMPEYDGCYAIEEIKDINMDAKIVAVTGDPGADESFLLDVFNIIVINKPFDMNSVKQAIADVFLQDDSGEMEPFKVRYKFKGDKKHYSCVMTYEQYRNFKNLPAIETCQIADSRQKIIQMHHKKMQEALDMAFRNDMSHIRMLSEIV